MELEKQKEPSALGFDGLSGLIQVFEHLPVNRRIEIEEGSQEFAAKPFVLAPATYLRAGEIQKPEALPSSVETWLIEPLSAPEFSLPDLTGNVRDLRALRGGFVLLYSGQRLRRFVGSSCAFCRSTNQISPQAGFEFWASTSMTLSMSQRCDPSSPRKEFRSRSCLPHQR